MLRFVRVLGLLALGWSSPMQATAVQPKSGLVLTPAFQTVQVKQSDSRIPFELTIFNYDKAPQTFALTAVDFGSLDEEGGVAFLGAPASELEHKYGLAAWLELGQKTVTINPGQSSRIQVAIMNKDSLTAGGHYGAVLATAQLAGNAVKGEQVGVQQVMSSLVLAVKEGDTQIKLELNDLKLNSSFWHLPTEVTMRFHNSGNVHAVVRGMATVEDMRGHKIAQGELNEGSTLVLPESNRKYQIKLRNVDKAWLPGWYQVRLQYRDDSSVDAQTVARTIWYFGALIVWVVVFIGIVLAFVLGWWLFGHRRSFKRSRF